MAIIGIGLIVVTNLITVLLNRKKMTKGVLALLIIGTVFGSISVLYSSNDLKKKIGELNEQVTQMSQPAVEFVPGQQWYDSAAALWKSEYYFRTNPALNARDVSVVVKCSGPITKANCYRETAQPGQKGVDEVQLSWDNEPFSFKFAVDFLAANESLRAVVQSNNPLNTPTCTIKTWTRKPPV